MRIAHVVPCLVVVAACGGAPAPATHNPPANATSWVTPASSSQTAPAYVPAAREHEDAVTLGAPASHCAAAPEPMHAPPPVIDRSDTPVDVKTTAKGVALDTNGATAGRVLTAIATASKHPIAVHGTGAEVRIYAHVRDEAYDKLVREVAHAAGLDVVESGPDKTLIAVDARSASEQRRRQEAASLAGLTLETRAIPAKSPAAIAHVIAMTLLSCRGKVTGASERGLVVVTDAAEVIERAEQLVSALDAVPQKPIHLEFKPLRHPENAGWNEEHVVHCATRPAAPAPAAPGGRTTAEGSAAGDLLRNVARAKNEDVVVGCGGDLPAFYVPGAAGATLADAGHATGLVHLGGNAYGSHEVARHARGGHAEHDADKNELVTFPAAHVRELAAAADDMIGDPSAAVPYEPAQVLVVSARRSGITRIEALVKEWVK